MKKCGGGLEWGDRDHILILPRGNYLLIPQKVDTPFPRTCEVLRYRFHMSSKSLWSLANNQFLIMELKVRASNETFSLVMRKDPNHRLKWRVIPKVCLLLLFNTSQRNLALQFSEKAVGVHFGCMLWLWRNSRLPFKRKTVRFIWMGIKPVGLTAGWQRSRALSKVALEHHQGQGVFLDAIFCNSFILLKCYIMKKSNIHQMLHIPPLLIFSHIFSIFPFQMCLKLWTLGYFTSRYFSWHLLKTRTLSYITTMPLSHWQNK